MGSTQLLGGGAGRRSLGSILRPTAVQKAAPDLPRAFSKRS